MSKVLVCVADAQLFLLLRHLLAGEGFDAVLVSKPSEIGSLAELDISALVIAWPGEEGQGPALLSCARLEFPSASVILLSRDGAAVRPGECDLFLQRPFDPASLMGFLRRLALTQRAIETGDNPESLLRFADLEMNLAMMSVRRGGNSVHLSALQFRILRRLLQEPAMVCDREELIKSCWPVNADVEPRTVDIHIGHVRRALQARGPDLIRTVRGRGYALQCPENGCADHPT